MNSHNRCTIEYSLSELRSLLSYFSFYPRKIKPSTFLYLSLFETIIFAIFSPFSSFDSFDNSSQTRDCRIRIGESSRSTYRRIACLIRRIERTRASTLLDRDRVVRFVQSRTRRNSRCPLAETRYPRQRNRAALQPYHPGNEPRNRHSLIALAYRNAVAVGGTISHRLFLPSISTR